MKITMKNDKYWTEDWNNHYKSLMKECQLKGLAESEAGNYVNDGMADYCEELILEAKYHYYKTGETIMSDSRYDKLEESLKRLRPTSKVLNQVGC